MIPKLLKKYILLTGLMLLLAPCGTVLGQQILEVTGYVVNAETGQGVPFASVGVVQQQIGISANLKGYFNLRLNGSDPEHTLEISSIGYDKQTISFSEIKWGTELRISLTPRSTLLSEVVIIGKKLSVEELVQDVSKKRQVFLRSTPYLMNVFYRETMAVNNKYQGLTEAQGIFYVNGFDKKYKNHDNPTITYDLAQWKNVRRNQYPSPEYLRVGKLLKAKDYYLHEGPLHKRNLDKFFFSIVDSTQYQEQLVLVIKFVPKPIYRKTISYEGKMLIKQDDQALLKLEVQHLGPEPFLNQSEGVEPQKSSFTIDFLLFDGKYFLNRSSFIQWHISQQARYKHTMEIIGGRFTDQKPEFMNLAQKTVLYSDMLNPLINYDPNFWSNFTFAESDALMELRKDRPNLPREFAENHQLRLIPLPEGFDTYQQMVNDQNLLDFFMQY